MIKFYSPAECVKEARKLMFRNGFILTYSKNSLYFMKKNHRGRKIRISDHVKTLAGDNHQDIVADIVFSSPTIINDIEYQIKQAMKEYSKFKVNTD